MGTWTSIVDGFDAAVQHPRLLLDDYSLPYDHGCSIAAGIIAGTACAICDGSFFPDGSFGGAAWGLFSAVDADDPLLGFNWVPGMPSNQSSFHSELSGIDGVLTSLEIIVFFHDITSGSITLGIDCTGAMNRSKSDYPLRSFQPSFDILQDIRERLEMLPITVHWRGVEGHQDDNIPYHKLDWWGQRNVDMDTRAKEFAQTCRSRNHPYVSPQLLYEKWAYKIDGVKQTSFSIDSIYAQVYGSKLQDYWIRKDDLPPPQTPIMWEEAQIAYRRLPLGLRRFRVKFLSQHCGIGIRLQLRGDRQSSACLLCDEQFEDRDHVFRCKHGAMREKFLEKQVELHVILKKQQTCPDLTEAILRIFGSLGQNHTLTAASFPTAH